MPIITSTHFFKIFPLKVKMNVNAVSRCRDILIYLVLRWSVTTVHYTLTTFQTACCLRYNRYAEGVRFVISSDERKFNPCGNKGQCNKFLYKYVGFFLSASFHQYSIFIVLPITNAIYSHQLTESLNNTLTRSTRSHTITAYKSISIQKMHEVAL
jgi:hypothetical protein